MDILKQKYKEFLEGSNRNDGRFEDKSKFHSICECDFEEEGYFMIICTQAFYPELRIEDMKTIVEIWKVYKTDKYFHVLEFQSPFIHNHNDTFSLYGYYDYNVTSDPNKVLYRGSTEILGLKLDDNLVNELNCSSLKLN